jgi:hypothetical protein
VPTSINVAPLLLASSSMSANGTTSSARLCKITVPGFTARILKSARLLTDVAKR